MKFLLSVFSICIAFSCFGQEAGDVHAEEDSHRWAISLTSINSHIPQVENPRAWSVIPAWGAGVEYRLSERWFVFGLVEVELMSYIVKLEEGQELEREFPVIICAGLGYELLKGWVLEAAYGREFEPTESFDLLHVATGYAFGLPNNWHVGPGISLNTRFQGYPTWSFKITFAKSF